MIVTVIVPGQPQGKARAKVSTVGGFAREYTPEKTAAYENLIKLCYGAKPHLNGEITMIIDAYFAVPKNFSKKKAALALNGELRPKTKPDADNIAKVVCDALNKIAYDDDAHIVSLTVNKSYATTPKVEIRIQGERGERG